MSTEKEAVPTSPAGLPPDEYNTSTTIELDREGRWKAVWHPSKDGGGTLSLRFDPIVGMVGPYIVSRSYQNAPESVEMLADWAADLLESLAHTWRPRCSDCGGIRGSHASYCKTRRGSS